MRRLVTLILALAVCASANAQMLWPIAGAEAGEGIIYKPQQYLDDELVFDDLFIAAPQGTAVVAPADGTLRDFSVCEHPSLLSMTGFRSGHDNFDGIIENLLSQSSEKLMWPDYLSGSVSIVMPSGYVYHIDGLRGDVPFKTGMKIHKGDTLGTVWKSYHKIREPHIRIAVSKNSRAADPMLPFGLESTFIPPQEVRIPDRLTADQAREDLTILFEAYEECYPSKHDIITEEQDSLFQAQAYDRIADGLSYKHFYSLVRSTTSSLYCHDSHLYMLTPAPEMRLYPNLNIFPSGDSPMVYSATIPCEHLIGKRVVSINGLDAEHYIRRSRESGTLFDADNQSRRAARQSYIGFYGMEVLDTLTRTEVVFADGTTYTDIWMDRGSYMKKMRPMKVVDIAYQRNMYARQMEKKDYRFEALNDSTCLFTLRTFDLNTVQIERVVSGIKAYSDYENMIIDLRDNYGGESEVMKELLTHFLVAEPVKLNQYYKVNSNTGYESFKHSLNYSPEFEIFSDYTESEEGCCLADTTMVGVAPDSLVNYKGKIYVLTGENTCSAASLFASNLVRNRRACTVGRETGSGYHWMTALKFVDILLPNSKIQVRIPLVKCVFDDTVTDRTPLGRGLMPDYEVPLTYEEVYTSADDIILGRALELIAEGQYLSDENPFEEIDNPDEPLIEGWLLALSLAVGFLIVAILRLILKAK